MTNILSLHFGQHISGKEINDWCTDQIKNHKSHERDARRLFRKNYSDARTYAVCLNKVGSAVDAPFEIVFCRVSEATA